MGFPVTYSRRKFRIYSRWNKIFIVVYCIYTFSVYLTSVTKYFPQVHYIIQQSLHVLLAISTMLFLVLYWLSGEHNWFEESRITKLDLG